MRPIIIRAIPHADQRYDTSGDWWLDGEGALQIRVSAELGDLRYQMLVAIHELVEALWCLAHGVTAEQVDAFDLTWPNRPLVDDPTARWPLRLCADGTAVDEPGDDPAAPYHDGHMLGSGIEQVMARALGVDWDAYMVAFETLPEWKAL